jgi:hypothetical protein
LLTARGGCIVCVTDVASGKQSRPDRKFRRGHEDHHQRRLCSVLGHSTIRR